MLRCCSVASVGAEDGSDVLPVLRLVGADPCGEGTVVRPGRRAPPRHSPIAEHPPGRCPPSCSASAPLKNSQKVLSASLPASPWMDTTMGPHDVACVSKLRARPGGGIGAGGGGGVGSSARRPQRSPEFLGLGSFGCLQHSQQRGAGRDADGGGELEGLSLQGVGDGVVHRDRGPWGAEGRAGGCGRATASPHGAGGGAVPS